MKNRQYFLVLVFIEYDFVMCSKAYFPKRRTFRNYREITGNTSRLHSTSEMIVFMVLISSNTSKAETGSLPSKKRVIVRSPNHPLWECSPGPKHEINIPFKTETIYLVLLFVATLIIESKYFHYAYQQIIGPEIFKIPFYFTKKICSVKESRPLNLK